MGVLERGVVRDLVEAQRATQIGQIDEELNDAAVVRLEELPQHENGEQLVLREIVAGEWRGVRRDRLPRDPHGHPGQCHRRLRHASLGLHAT